LVTGALAQRALPAAFAAAALGVPARYAIPWLAWMTCWGLRGMILHQARDAVADRATGLATWGATHEDVVRRARGLMAVLVPLELASFVVAVMPLLADTEVLVAAIVALAGWTLLKAGTFARFHAGSVRVDWLSARSMPFADIYAVFAPMLVAIALARSGGWAGWTWIALDLTVRLPALRNTWRRVRSLVPSARVGGARTRAWLRGAATDG
jgi:hypothetical protein